MLIDRRQWLTGAAMLGATALVPAARAAAAVPLPERFAAAAIRADLATLAEVYGRLHPGLTRYLAPGAFTALVTAAQRWADRDRTPSEIYLMLSRLTATVRCGHSFPNPANQRRTVQQDLLGRRDRLPFCARWLGRRLVVTDPLASGLAAGTVVQAIDGVASERLLAAMLPLTRADGHNDAKRLAQLELHRGDRYAAFDLFRPMLQLAQVGRTVLTIAPPVGRRRQVELPTVAEGARGVAAADDPQYGWRFALDADGVGVLTMPDWSLYDSKWDWRGFLDRVADRLVDERARGLIVDVRENEGGLDCGDVLLARLTDRPIAPQPGQRLVRFRETPPALRPLLDTWDASFHTMGVGAPPAPDRPGYFTLRADPGQTIVPVGRRFAGPVAVLVGPTCSSATFQFADVARRHRRGTLVGAPTGGNRRGINGGCFFFVTLPETRFEVDLPLIGYFPDTPQPDAGVVPDVRASPTIADIAAGRDPGLAAARRVVLG